MFTEAAKTTASTLFLGSTTTAMDRNGSLLELEMASTRLSVSFRASALRSPARTQTPTAAMSSNGTMKTVGVTSCGSCGSPKIINLSS